MTATKVFPRKALFGLFSASDDRHQRCLPLCVRLRLPHKTICLTQRINKASYKSPFTAQDLPALCKTHELL